MNTPIQARRAALLAAAILAMSSAAHAQTSDSVTSAVPEAASASAAAPLSFNAAITSDYRYRGISQTRLQPALQGGVEYVHDAGWYAGAWASSVKFAKDAGGDGALEIDLYAGKRGLLAPGLSYDVGVLRYLYPDNGLGQIAGFASANTTELYVQLGHGPAYVKYAHATTSLFGFVDSHASGYLDLGANLDAGHGFTLQLHAGHQRVQNNAAAHYSDWKIGLARGFGLASVALAYVGTNAGKSAYASPRNGKFTGRDALQLTVSRTF